jgi:hypothetical protein
MAEKTRVHYWDRVPFVIILILVTLAAIGQPSARARWRPID